MAEKWDQKSTGKKIAFILLCLATLVFSVISPLLATVIIGVILYRNYRAPKSK
jgi:hypothetical protein